MIRVNAYLIGWVGAFVETRQILAWRQWLQHQTVLINECRLFAIDPKARKFLAEEMEKFLFSGGSEKPKDYVPEK